MKYLFFILLSILSFQTMSQTYQFDYDSTQYCFASSPFDDEINNCSQPIHGVSTVRLDLQNMKLVLFRSGEEIFYQIDPVYVLEVDSNFIYLHGVKEKSEYKILLTEDFMSINLIDCPIRFIYLNCKK